MRSPTLALPLTCSRPSVFPYYEVINLVLCEMAPQLTNFISTKPEDARTINRTLQSPTEEATKWNALEILLDNLPVGRIG